MCLSWRKASKRPKSPSLQLPTLSNPKVWYFIACRLPPGALQTFQQPKTQAEGDGKRDGAYECVCFAMQNKVRNRTPVEAAMKEDTTKLVCLY